MKALAILQQQLAPYGILRAAINLSNPLLIEQQQASSLNNHPITGVSPSFAQAIATRLQVPLQLIPYDHPDDICAAAEAAVATNGHPQTPWDIALIGADPDRAAVIDFTPAYCEIHATCMVPSDSPVTSFEQLNRDGVRISTKGGGAYDLWLTRNWKNAAFLRERTLDDSYNAYSEHTLDALAGLRPRLLEDLERSGGAGHRLLEGSFMSVQQAVGCFKTSTDACGGVEEGGVSPGHAFLCDFVEESRRAGNIVEQLIEAHGTVGRLSLPTVEEP